MATKGNSNRTQKNGVRYVLATGVTMLTLLGAQSLAFAGKSAEATQSTATTVAIVPTVAASPTDNVAIAATQVASPTTIPTVTPTIVQATKITVAAAQPAPRSQSSR
jgi:hypothetical protein